MRRLHRTLLLILAMLFLLEAWLWDCLAPIVARVVHFIPLQGLKDGIRRFVAQLSPPATLVVAAIPLLALSVPLKFLELYAIATGQWLLAILVLLFVKLVGVGVTAFIFDATRDKLLQMAWFARMYDWFVWARDWAHAQIDPIMARARRYLRLLKPERAGRFWRLFLRMRRRMQRA
jgi:hypothetical protein